MNPHPKTTTSNPTNLPNHPQLIFNYPPSASTIPPPQTQHTISPLTQSTFHPSSPSRNNLRILQWNANGICPRRTKLTHFLSQNQYDFIFVQESHLSSDFTFRIPGYKTLQKNRSMTWKGTTNSTGNLGDGVLILVKNGLTYISLSTQSLSSLDPSSDYLAITAKIKGASPIHLFNVYVPPIRSSSSNSRPKSFSPFFLPSSPTTYIFGDFNSHHSSWDSYSPEDQSGKDLFDWLLLIFYPSTTPNIILYYTVPPETAPPLISLKSLPKQPLNAHDRLFQTSVQIIFLSLSPFLPPI